MFEQILDADSKILIYLNNLGTSMFDWFWMACTNEVTWIPLFVFIVLSVYRRFSAELALKILMYALLLLAANLLLTEIVKEAVGRIRPNNDRAMIHALRILTSPPNYSFFSGHASSSFCITVFLILTLKKHFKSISWLWIWPILFTYSRIYIGVHYPSDLIVGALFGGLLAIVFYRLYENNTLKKLIKAPYKPSARPEWEA
ncbi:MAG: phosphatase PAP2 family protein [Flavobacteriaceae bacterium]|nr:phosphatase PAP2 family protein [Flavobacteriaceae bacterium]MDZ4147331.1 phosphatase PAP2 family protein [Flavobacteriaceae bacterium]